MSKINVLDSKVYNRISAGEVVERPASVVKEVVENAIDAGATSITIEIEEGGTKLIKVSDNGSGIEFDDLKKAFLPHATSKICDAEDLDSITTLGFRGEALASIGAVSQVEIVSKTPEAETGGMISVSGGIIDSPVPCAHSAGTTISIKNLFYNTPARLKFLKSNKQEEGLVTNIVDRLMLSNPNISFKYIVDGATVYNSVLSGLKEKIYTIYGKNTSQNIIEINAQNQKFKIFGYISAPLQCKANRTYQTLIINGRYVNNSLISVAISNAYANFLMKGKFPLYVISLSLPYEDIDVNVHPSKMEVRFKQTKEIYDFFYSNVLQTLQNNNFPLELGILEPNEPTFVPNLENTAPNLNKEIGEIKGGFSFGDLQKFSQEIQNINVSAPTYKEENISKLAENNAFSSTNLDSNSKTIADSYFATNANNEKYLFDMPASIPHQNKQETYIPDIPYKIVGTLFNTYLLIESQDSLYMIDQHAGHERILYDKFTELFNQKKLNTQDLLLPYLFEVNQIEKNLVEDNLDVFKELGFGIEQFGNNSFRITAVPAILSNINLQEFITESLSDINKISSTNEQIKNKLATAACKAAVKGGQNLSENEIQVLLKDITKPGRILQCPHGRPVCIKLTRYEIEKMFKRIVS